MYHQTVVKLFDVILLMSTFLIEMLCSLD